MGDPRPSSDGKEQPLELILARNLVSIISLAAFLVDVDWHIVFYNDAAAEIMGSRFEETGSLTRDRWNAEVGPVDEQGQPVPFDRLPLTIALRDGRPAYGRHCIRAKQGPIEMEAGTMPLVGPAGHRGVILVLWPLHEDQAE